MRGSLLLIAFTLIITVVSVPTQAEEWPDYADIGPTLASYAVTYPTLCEYMSLGQSVDGRELWAIHISDNIGVEENEPEFKYVSTMHGDEIQGTMCCMKLIDYLLTNYGTNSQVTNIVNEVDLWIVPLMNPDGYDKTYRTRTNYNGVDLNRNFPDYGDANSTAGRAAETVIIMNWTAAHSFVASANFHSGALVANYPFDNDLPPSGRHSPDEDVFYYMSEQYAMHNTPMWNSTEWTHGITLGADWYSVNGGMQDWNIHFHKCIEITMELGDTKEPSSSQITTIWNQNRASMLAYIETCLMGVRGIVTDGATGLPVAATVSVAGRDLVVNTDPAVGNYHRMLLPGTYDLTFETAGYDPVTVNNVVVSSGNATVLNVTFAPPAEIVSPNGGEELAVGMPATVTWSGNPTNQYQVQYTDSYDDDVVTDSFERTIIGTPYIITGDRPWVITNSDYHTGSKSASPNAMNNNHIAWLRRMVNDNNISFWYKVSSQSGSDYFNFYVGGNLELHVSGEVDWTYYSTSLPAGNQEIKWEYIKDSSGSSGSDTVWIDDVQIGNATVWTDIVNPSAVGASTATWTPPTASSDYKVRVRTYYGPDHYGEWDESDGTFSAVAPTADGDYDDDGDVDLKDFAGFQACIGSPATGDCGNAFEFTLDGIINATDYAGFQAALDASGPGN